MKIKYLPSEDRQALRQLRHTEDREEMAEVLAAFLQRPYSVQAIWEYRKWFLMMTPEELRKRPILASGVMQIYVLSGDLQKALELLDYMPKEADYYFFSRLTMPRASRHEWKQVLAEMKQCGLTPFPRMLVTAGRPSLLNGVWDFTRYADALLADRSRIRDLIAEMYGEKANSICELAYAEALYYRNRCYESLVVIVGLIPFLKEKQDMQLLFVALAFQIYIMVQNGQTTSTVPLIEGLRKQMGDVQTEEYMPNIDALEAWCAMYDGDYRRVAKWVREGAPNEYAEFCMLDLYRYMIKMRAYIIQGKYFAVTALAMKLRPLLEEGGRKMDLCELHMIWAMSDFAGGRREEAFEHLEKSLELSEANGYDRLLADEGKRVNDLLKAYREEMGSSPYVARIADLAEKSEALYPRYLKNQLPEKPALTSTELRILRLLQYNYTNTQISDELGIALETAKKHCKNIFAKLEVKNRQQAVMRAVEYGILKDFKWGEIPII